MKLTVNYIEIDFELKKNKKYHKVETKLTQR